MNKQILFLLISFFSLSLVFGDSNGVWIDASDIRGGTFGSDESATLFLFNTPLNVTSSLIYQNEELNYRFVNRDEIDSITSSMIVNNSIVASDIDPSEIQRRIVASCPSEYSITSISQSGLVVGCDYDNINDSDSDPSNEHQTLSMTGYDITLSKGGGTVTIPPLSEDSIGAYELELGYEVGSVYDSRFVNHDEIDSITSSMVVDGSIGSSDIDSSEVQRRITGFCFPNQKAINITSSGFIGCATDLVDDADNNPNNELQNLSISGSTLSITNGNSVTLPADADSDITNELQSLSISGTLISLSGGGGSVTLPDITSSMIVDDTISSSDVDSSQIQLRISGPCPVGSYVFNILENGNVVCSTVDVDDADNNPNNELQTLSISGRDITLSNGGGSVNVPLSPDTNAETLCNSGEYLDGDGNCITPIDNVNDADSDITNELQSLSISGTLISLSDGGGSVTLPDITSSMIVDGTISSSDVDSSQLQLRVGSCPPGQYRDNILASGAVSCSTDLVADADNNPSNELQTLSISGSTINLSNGGGSVTVPTSPDTNAGTLCSSGQYLDGDGTCKSIPVDTNTNTNAGTLCSPGQYLDGDGTCKSIPVDTNTNTNAGTLCSSGQYLDGDGTCKSIPVDTDTNTNAQTQCATGQAYLGDGTCRNLWELTKIYQVKDKSFSGLFRNLNCPSNSKVVSCGVDRSSNSHAAPIDCHLEIQNNRCVFGSPVEGQSDTKRVYCYCEVSYNRNCGDTTDVYTCSDNNVHYMTNCGEVGSMKEDCNSGDSCNQFSGTCDPLPDPDGL